MPKSDRPKRRYSPKTRAHETNVQFTAISDEHGTIKIDVEPDGRIVSRHAVEGSFSLIKRYKRDSGKDKIAFAYKGNSNGAFLSEKVQLLSNFDRLLCIDTNTIMINDMRVSATSLFLSKFPLSEADDKISFDIQGYVFFDVPMTINPEMVAIDIALFSYLSPSSTRTGIITDSELGKHDEINERKIPFLGNKLLRNDVSLIYASADIGDAMSNKIIKQCDIRAKQLLDHCKSHPEELKPTDNSYPFCRGWMCLRTNS